MGARQALLPLAAASLAPTDPWSITTASPRSARTPPPSGSPQASCHETDDPQSLPALPPTGRPALRARRRSDTVPRLLRRARTAPAVPPRCTPPSALWAPWSTACRSAHPLPGHRDLRRSAAPCLRETRTTGCDTAVGTSLAQRDSSASTGLSDEPSESYVAVASPPLAAAGNYFTAWARATLPTSSASAPPILRPAPGPLADRRGATPAGHTASLSRLTGTGRPRKGPRQDLSSLLAHGWSAVALSKLEISFVTGCPARTARLALRMTAPPSDTCTRPAARQAPLRLTSRLPLPHPPPPRRRARLTSLHTERPTWASCPLPQGTLPPSDPRNYGVGLPHPRRAGPLTPPSPLRSLTTPKRAGSVPVCFTAGHSWSTPLESRVPNKAAPSRAHRRVTLPPPRATAHPATLSPSRLRRPCRPPRLTANVRPLLGATPAPARDAPPNWTRRPRVRDGARLKGTLQRLLPPLLRTPSLGPWTSSPGALAASATAPLRPRPSWTLTASGACTLL